MHARSSSNEYYRFMVILVLHTTVILQAECDVLYNIDTSRKCCLPDYLFNENFECVKRIQQNETNVYATETSMEQLIVVEETLSYATFKCQHANDSGIVSSKLSASYKNKYKNNGDAEYSILYVPLNYCIEDTTNGTKVVAKCPELGTRGESQQPEHGDTSPELEMVVFNCSLSAIVFWGYQAYITSNMVHMVLCIIVVIVYLSVPELGRGLYNRAVLRHNISLMMHGILLTNFAYCDRDDIHIPDGLNNFLWIVMQFFANTTVFWLNVICFDMTLVITRFRWMPGAPHQRSDSAENRRFLLYSTFAWGSAIVPAIIAAICDYTPTIPRTFFLKPNYLEYAKGPSIKVSLYFFGLPLLTLLLNNVLFFYTTYKIIMIQRSTEIATKNQTNMLKKKYFLFLRLYLLMGAPWFFGVLLACLEELIILKIFRIVQPILWLLMLSTQKDLRKKLVKKFRFTRNEEKQVATMNI